jgi:acyl CoA:acetate/3-ketoacid CoA transferase alpha subunit
VVQTGAVPLRHNADGTVAKYTSEVHALEGFVLADVRSNHLFDLLRLEEQTETSSCRSGGAGIPAFYTPAAFGTVVQTGAVPLRHNADAMAPLKLAAA